MTCPKCQALNAEGSKLCINCGEPLQSPVTEAVNQNINIKPVENVIPEQQVINPEPVMNQMPNIPQEPSVTNQTVIQSAVPNNVSMENEKLNIFGYLKSFITKPYATYEKYENQFNDSKNALLLSGIIALLMMVINIIKTYVSTIFITFGGELRVDFSLVKYIDIFDLIFKNLLSSFGIIAVIAFIYYVVGLIFKKNSNFLKLLVSTASSSIPYILISILLSTILEYIWAPLAFITLIVGALMTLIIFLTLMRKEFSFPTKDQEIFFNVICLSAVFIIGYFIMTKMLETSGGLLDFFE